MSMNVAQKEVVKLSFFFFLLFTSFFSCLSIVTHIFEEEGLSAIGPACLGTFYLVFTFSALLAPSCRWKYKTQLLIGSISYTLFLSCGIFIGLVDLIFLKYLIPCVGAVIAGSFAGNLWVSQGAYIHLLCKQHHIPAQQKGKYFGMFGSLYCISNIFAGILTTFGYGLFGQQTYFLILTFVGSLSIIFCWFFITDIQSEPDEEIGVEEIKINFKDKLKSSIAFYPVMISVLPILIIDGICLGIYSSEITHLVPKDYQKDENSKIYAGLCTICLGIGSVIGGKLSGVFADKLKQLWAVYVSLIFFLVACLLCMITVQVQIYAMTLIASTFWGFTLFYLEGWMCLACSRYFEGKPEAFSINKQVHNIFYLFFQIFILITKNQINLFILFGAITIFSIPAVIFVTKLPIQQKKVEVNAEHSDIKLLTDNDEKH